MNSLILSLGSLPGVFSEVPPGIPLGVHSGYLNVFFQKFRYGVPLEVRTSHKIDEDVDLLGSDKPTL